MSKNLFTKGGHLTEYAIAIHSKDSSNIQIKEHLDSCQICKNNFDLLTDFLEEHEYVDVQQETTNYFSYMKIAALLLFSFSIGYFSLFYEPHNEFSRHSGLESFVNSTLRSESVSINHPKNDFEFTSSDSIKFDLSLNKHNSYNIELLSNDSKVVTTLVIDSISIIPSNTLKQGRYYWKLIEDDQIIHVGTFTLK